MAANKQVEFSNNSPFFLYASFDRNLNKYDMKQWRIVTKADKSFQPSED